MLAILSLGYCSSPRDPCAYIFGALVLPITSTTTVSTAAIAASTFRVSFFIVIRLLVTIHAYSTYGMARIG